MKTMESFTITVFSENRTGLLSRIVGLITRRKINIETLTVSKSSMEGIHRFTIVLTISEEVIIKVVNQIDKQVDVLKAFYYRDEEIVHQEIALYKVPADAMYNSNQVERMIRLHNARILTIEPEYVVVEKTGHQHETEALLEDLRSIIGVYEFVRSGRIAVVKPMEQLNKYLKSIEKEESEII
jgi:acetolactate synthase-1/3 small subunit